MTKPAAVVEVGPNEAAHLTDTGQALLLDVREDGEWRRGHAPKAVHVPLGDLDPMAVPRDRKSLPSAAAATARARRRRRCRQRARTSATWRGGMNAWATAGLPVTRTDGLSGEIA